MHYWYLKGLFPCRVEYYQLSVPKLAAEPKKSLHPNSHQSTCKRNFLIENKLLRFCCCFLLLAKAMSNFFFHLSVFHNLWLDLLLKLHKLRRPADNDWPTSNFTAFPLLKASIKQQTGSLLSFAFQKRPTFATLS